MDMQRWRDERSDRDVYLLEIRDPSEWPATLPWTCRHFGLLVLTVQVVDVSEFARRVIDRGLASVCADGTRATNVVARWRAASHRGSRTRPTSDARA